MRTMKRLISACAGAVVLTVAMTGVAEASAAPLAIDLTQLISDDLVLSIAYVDGADATEEPRQSSVRCSTRAHNGFSGRRTESGVVYGDWHTRYHTADCEVSGYDHEMSYINVTHDTRRGSGGFWTSQISQCEGYQS